MKKIDARSLPRDAQDEMRRQAIRMREQLKMTWAEIAKVVGVSETTAWGWGKRYLSEGEGGLVSRPRSNRQAGFWCGRRDRQYRRRSWVSI